MIVIRTVVSTTFTILMETWFWIILVSYYLLHTTEKYKWLGLSKIFFITSTSFGKEDGRCHQVAVSMFFILKKIILIKNFSFFNVITKWFFFFSLIKVKIFKWEKNTKYNKSGLINFEKANWLRYFVILFCSYWKYFLFRDQVTFS